MYLPILFIEILFLVFVCKDLSPITFDRRSSWNSLVALFNRDKKKGPAANQMFHREKMEKTAKDDLALPSCSSDRNISPRGLYLIYDASHNN